MSEGAVARTVSVPRSAYTGGLTGTRYAAARAVGLIADRKPNANERLWLDAVLRVQADQADLLPLTPRTYGYLIAPLPGFTKKVAQTGIVDFLVLARRCCWIGLDTVDDSRTREDLEPGFLGPEELEKELADTISGYERWRRLGQKWAPEVWVEAVGSMKSVTEPAHAYGARVLSSGGTNSFTALVHLTARAVDRYKRWRMRTVVLLVGDFDAKGRERMDRTQADAVALLADLWFKGNRDYAAWLLRFKWVAVQEWQVEQWQLLPSDDAGRNYEVEAVPPTVLRDELTRWLKGYTSTRLLARVVAASEAEREYRLERSTS